LPEEGRAIEGEGQALLEEIAPDESGIRLIDTAGKPIANQKVKFVLPDGSVRKEITDEDGKALEKPVDKARPPSR